MTRRQAWTWMVCGVWGLGAGAAGCGGAVNEGGMSSVPASTVREAPGRPVNARGNRELVTVIGPAGGSMELSSGPRVEIPAGALEDGVEFVLKEAPLTTVFANDEAEKAAGPTFLLSPGVGSDGAPIRVSIPMAKLPDGFGEPTLQYEYEKGARVGAEDAVHTQWDMMPAQMAGGRMVAETDALPGLRLQFTVTDQNVQ